MKESEPDFPSRAPGPGDRWILALSGLVALVPYAAYHGMFARLYWFGDEFDLIDQIDRLGFWHWMWTVFAENFVPLFKLLWGAGVFAFHGSYAAMIALVWLTHAVNVALLGRLMRACGLGWAAVFLAQIAFGLTPANIETLGWSVQWSAVLSSTFMLLALGSFFRSPFRPISFVWSAASALSFSRGVLTGVLLGLASLRRETGANGQDRPKRFACAAGYLLPAIAVAAWIAILASGNQNHMKGHWGEAAVFCAWYYCLNPVHSLLSFESWGWRTVVLLGLCKVFLVGWSILRSRGRLRLLFLLLVAFDLGNSVLVGIGRFHIGLTSTVASRYQYASLIAIAPLAGFWLSRQWSRIPIPGALRGIAGSALLALGALYFCLQWPAPLDIFTNNRGTESRRILLLEANPDPHSVPGIPFLEVNRARTLIDRYGLH
jgi:hypothetical protein